MWPSRPQKRVFVQISCMITTVPNLDEKRPIETHPYELLKIKSTHHVSLNLTNVHRLFWKRSFLYIVSQSKLQIPSKKIEYIEVKERSLLTEIIEDFDEDIDPNSSLKKMFLYIVRANCKFPLRRSNT